MHRADSHLHAIMYMSQKTLQCAVKYHSYELKVLAVIAALTKGYKV